jgi:crotonobetainyl-CoA:carnitine CoA-transferase CaiB-like acyl-CoA transferase
MSLPLDGVRVLAVEQYGAGPYASMFLAQLGAEVIKIENPATGDFSRQTGPHFLPDGDSLFFQTFNLNKRAIALDLKAADGVAILHALVATADVVLNNLRGDQPEALGLDYAALKAIRPAIVCAHLSAYGRSNERAAWPGYDYLMQAEAGFLSLTGEPEAPPARFGLSMVDYMAGMMLAFATVSAVLKARTTGEGGDVDVSLFDAALHQLTYPATWYLNTGAITGRAPRSAHPSITPSQLLRTADGWIFIMAQMPKFYSALCERIGRPELVGDPRFATMADRLANREALTRELDATLSTRTTAAWMALLAGAIPCAPVHDLAQALDNPFVASGGMVETVSHPAADALRVLASPIRLDGARPPAQVAPRLGQDTDAVLGALGLAPERIADLRARGVIA